MKKAGKLLSYLLVLTLITGLFSGLGIAKSPTVEANAAVTFNVLEIVPDKSMATFFYFVDLNIHTNTSKSDNPLYSKIDTNAVAGTVNTFLKNALCGELKNGAFESTDYFNENVLKRAGITNANIKINTVTPSELENSIGLLNSANLIVINETVPKELRFSGQVTMKTFEQSTFSKTLVLKIFKKIAGAEGNTPVPYIMDFKLYNGAAFSDVRSINNDVSNAYGGYIPADKVHVLRETNEPDNGDVGTFIQNENSFYHMGTDRTSFKLYKLLSCIDPSTLYGLYFTGNDGSYGVDEDLNLIVAKPAKGKTKIMSYNLGGKDPGWTDTYFRPNYLARTGKMMQETVSATSYTKEMGWFEANTRNGEKLDKDPGEFCQVIGGKEGKAAGKGIVYNSLNGLFSIMKSTADVFEGSDEEDTPVELNFTVVVDGKSYTVTDAASLTAVIKEKFGNGLDNALSNDDFISRCSDFSISVKCNTNVVYKLTANGKNYEIHNLEELQKFLKDLGVPNAEVSKITEYPLCTSYASEIKDSWLNNNHEISDTWKYTGKISNASFVKTETWTKDGTAITGYDLKSKNGQISFIRNYAAVDADSVPDDATSMSSFLTNTCSMRNYSVTDNNPGSSSTTSSTGAGADQLAAIFLANKTNSARTDYYPYRFLVVTGRTASSSVNRNVIAEMVGYANSKGIGLVGGITVDCISWKQFEDISADLNQTYDAICIGHDLTSIGEAKLGTYSGTKLQGSNFTSKKLISKFKSIVGKEFGINYITVPKEYYTDLKANYLDYNGHTGYSITTNSLSVTKNLNFINDDDHTTKRSLDFKFNIIGDKYYDVDLYVDISNDGIYGNADKEKKRIATGKEGGSVLDKSGNDAIPLSEFGYPDDFVGGFSWKLVVTEMDKAASEKDRKATGKTICRVGYSAIKNREDTGHKIRILQIYPTGYMSEFGGRKSNTWISNPLLLLPNKAEIASAYNSKGSIINCTWNGYGNKKLQDYFSGIMSFDNITSEVRYKSTNTPVYDKFVGNEVKNVTKATYTLPGEKGADILKNAAIFYQFLALLNDYDVEVDRYSVYGFSSAAGSDIVYDKDTKRFASAANGDIVKNLDGSDRYGYTESQLKLSSDWKTATRSWSEGNVKKYLTNEAGTLIYGERGASDGQVTYYGSKKVVDGVEVDGKEIKKAGEDDVYDLIMLGFGNTMDYMDPNAVSMIETYLKNGGPAFVGNGTVTKDSNNNLGATIKGYLGMSNVSNGSDYDPFESFNQAMMITNDTLFSHFPYKINHYMWGSAAGVQPYKLDLSNVDNQPVVSYARYLTDAQKGEIYKNWGDSEGAYYLYRYNNITFCGFGNTFRVNQGDDSAIGNIMTVAETLMIVNALITSASGGQSGKKSEPYVKCIDADGSYIDESGMEEDQAKMFKDSVYTDFDSEAIAKFKNSGDTLFNTPICGNMTPEEFFAQTYTEAAGDKLKHTGFVSKDGVSRWIPYKVTLATKEGGYLKFYDANSVPTYWETVYKFEFKYDDAEKKTGHYEYVKQAPDENGMIKVDENAVYYIGIGISEGHGLLGFKLYKNTDATHKNVDQFAARFRLYADDKAEVLIEEHVLMMIRRVVYPTR